MVGSIATEAIARLRGSVFGGVREWSKLASWASQTRMVVPKALAERRMLVEADGLCGTNAMMGPPPLSAGRLSSALASHRCAARAVADAKRRPSGDSCRVRTGPLWAERKRRTIAPRARCCLASFSSSSSSSSSSFTCVLLPGRSSSSIDPPFVPRMRRPCASSMTMHSTGLPRGIPVTVTSHSPPAQLPSTGASSPHRLLVNGLSPRSP